MLLALKEYLAGDATLTALVPASRMFVEKVDQTASFPKIAIKLIASARKQASQKKVSNHKTYQLQIECQGGYDLNGTTKAYTDAMAVADAVEDRLCTLHNSLGNIGTNETAQIKSMSITDGRLSSVDIDPTIKPTKGSEMVTTYMITAEFTWKRGA